MFYVDFLAYHIQDTVYENIMLQMTYSSMAYLQLICDLIYHKCYRLHFFHGFLLRFLTVSNCLKPVQDHSAPLHFKDFRGINPDSKVHGDTMGPILDRQDPGGPHVGPINFVIWVDSPLGLQSNKNASVYMKQVRSKDTYQVTTQQDICQYTNRIEFRSLSTVFNSNSNRTFNEDFKLLAIPRKIHAYQIFRHLFAIPKCYLNNVSVLGPLSCFFYLPRPFYTYGACQTFQIQRDDISQSNTSD